MDIDTRIAMQVDSGLQAASSEHLPSESSAEVSCTAAGMHAKQPEAEAGILPHVADSAVRQLASSPIGNSPESKFQSGAQDRSGQACDWLPNSKREALVHAVNAQFQTTLGDSTEELETCRAFWLHAYDHQFALNISEIPPRLRRTLRGYTLEVFQKMLCKWWQGCGARTEMEKKVVHVMRDALNDIIVATNPSAASDDVRGTTVAQKEVTTPQASKRNYETMMTGPREQRRLRQKFQVRSQRNLFGSSRTCMLKLTRHVHESVQQTSIALMSWYEAYARRDKGGLVQEVVQVASKLATRLAKFSSDDLLQEFHHNTRFFGIVGFTIHKLVQVGAVLVQESKQTSFRSSCNYFVTLSGGARARVTQKCYTSVLASVNLLSVVWPQGFSSFTKLEDMPTLPPPTSCGQVYDAFANDLAVRDSCIALQQRLRQQSSEQKDTLLLRCSFQSLENLLLLFKEKVVVNANEVTDPVLFADSVNSAEAEIGKQNAEDAVFVLEPPKAEIEGKACEDVQLVHEPPPKKAKIEKQPFDDLQFIHEPPPKAMSTNLVVEVEDPEAPPSDDDEDILITSLGAGLQ